MKINVETISREMIKPSTPTPNHLRHYQYSYLDQIALSIPISLLYFYHLDDHKLVSSNNHLFINSLKSSLSNVLTKYYPLAGRIKNNYVDCNDEGVVFLEAKVSCQLSEIINEPKLSSEFNKLHPFGQEKDVSVNGLPIAIQVNMFNCGSVAIAVMMSHKIADALSLITFTKNWAATARGKSENIFPEFAAVRLFPPQDVGGSSDASVDPRPKKIVLQKFLFEGPKIAALRDKYGLDNEIYPTRVEALSAFIWSRLAASTRIKISPERPSILVHIVNLRKRMEPPLPDDSFGNIVGAAVTILEENDDDNRMVNKFRDAICKIDKDYMKVKKPEHSKLTNLFITNGGGEWGSCIFSSLCKFPVYEADFGLGKPMWVSWGRLPYKNIIHLIDTKSGDGIEAWVHLEEEVMAKFENDLELLAYVSLN